MMLSKLVLLCSAFEIYTDSTEHASSGSMLHMLE